MKISVVIPTKNRVPDLKECLDTLVAQTRIPDEVIIVDNSTNDETKEYINQWKHPEILQCIYIRRERGGTSSLRNTGIDRSTGDIVFFLDDDVILHVDYVRIITEILLGDTAERIGGAAGVGGWDLKDIGTIGLGVPRDLKELVNKGDEFSQRLRQLVIERYGRDIFEQSNIEYLIWSGAKWMRDLIGTVFLIKSFRKGRVLASGFRSDFPRSTTRAPFVRVDTLPGCNCFRRKVLLEYRFEENLEIFPYAVGEDQELCMRVAKKYMLAATSRAIFIHKRSPGARIDSRKQFISIIANHHYIVTRNMNRPINRACFWWAVFGISLSCLVRLVLRPSKESWLSFVGCVQGVKLALRQSGHHIPAT